MTNAITIVDSASTTTSGENNQTIITGTPTTGPAVATVSSLSNGTVSIDISGTWTGTLTFEQSPDGTNFSAVDAMQDGVDAVVQSTTANGLFKIAASADFIVRVRATAAITGTANIAFTGSAITDLQHVAVVNGNIDTGPLLTFTAAGASTVHSADQTNFLGTGLNCVVDITVATSTSLVLTIQGKDTASGKYYAILTSAALSSVATTLLSVFPGLTVAANTVVSAILPKTWRVTAAITGASSALTGTVSASVV